jgi:NAD-dependent dihydropyrimidine dehydrogenase PreA subunit
MIELIIDDRCIACDICVKVCPTNVFDPGAGDVPAIARQSDCQTCFMCEAYCPADALYVAPESAHNVDVDGQELSDSGKLGEYRVLLGWGTGRKSTSDQDTAHLLRGLRGGPFGRR